MAETKKKPEVSKVKLTAKDRKGKTTREFSEQQALKLLTLSNSQWELQDSNFEFNGKELKRK